MALALNAVAVTKGFLGPRGVTEVLAGLDLELQTGEFVCLLGPSGAGKSTLLHLLAGLEAPDNGRIWPAQRLGRIGLMPQRDLLLPWRSALDNAALGLLARGLPRREARQQARQLLERFGLTGFLHAWPHELSGGMRQRVALLRTALAGHDVWLLDEPFGALDAMTRLDLQEWLLEVWQALQKTVLFVTHDVEEALYLADRVVVLGPRPARVIWEVSVPLPRPRRIEMLADPQLSAVKVSLLRQLRNGVQA